MEFETQDYSGCNCNFGDDFGYFPMPSPQIDFSEINNLSAPADAPEDTAYPDMHMPEVNETVPLPVALPFAYAFSELSKKEAQWRLGSFRSAIERDLLPCTRSWDLDLDAVYSRYLEEAAHMYSQNHGLPERREIMSKPWYFFAMLVRSTGPDSKGRKPHHQHQGRRQRWKEKSMKGMRAVADPSSLQPPGQLQQQGYFGLKKTLGLDDDGNGNKWRAHEYTPLLPSHDGSRILVPAEILLRVEFKVDEPAPSPFLPLLFSKRSRNGASKNGPRTPVKSPVWEHMTKVHVTVATANTDGSWRKKPACYKVMFAICNHCDKVFNADSGHGTNNLSKHLDSCNCNCTHSHSH